MIAVLKYLIHRTLAAVAGVFAALASKFAPRAVAPHSGPPSIPAVNAEQAPQSALSPEEQLLLWRGLPDAILRSKVLTMVNQAGQIPDSVEQMRLTGAGKVLSRSDFLFLDDFGSLGAPEKLAGKCAFCSRVSFRATTCEVCGKLACPDCGAAFDDPAAATTRWLCKSDHRKAEFNRSLWPEAPPQAKQLRSSRQPDSPSDVIKQKAPSEVQRPGPWSKHRGDAHEHHE